MYGRRHDLVHHSRREFLQGIYTNGREMASCLLLQPGRAVSFLLQPFSLCPFCTTKVVSIAPCSFFLCQCHIQGRDEKGLNKKHHVMMGWVWYWQNCLSQLQSPQYSSSWHFSWMVIRISRRLWNWVFPTWWGLYSPLLNWFPSKLSCTYHVYFPCIYWARHIFPPLAILCACSFHLSGNVWFKDIGVFL